jgi:hypothetical protein
MVPVKSYLYEHLETRNYTVHVHVTLLVYMNRINWWNSCLTVGVLLEILLCSYRTCYRPPLRQYAASLQCERCEGEPCWALPAACSQKFCASYKQCAVCACKYSCNSDRRRRPNLRYDFCHRFILYSSAAHDQLKRVFELNKAFGLYVLHQNRLN